MPTTRASRASEMLLNSSSPLELLSAVGKKERKRVSVLCGVPGAGRSVAGV